MKQDFKKTLPSYKAKLGTFEIIEIPKLQYLMVDGAGDPNTSKEFQLAIEALYPVAYKLKFASKQQLNKDYVVPPLEGLWWADSMDAFTDQRDKSKWLWTLMIMTPDWITREMFGQAVDIVRAKNAPTKLDHIRLETLEEGICVQILHQGSFDEEGPTLDRLHNEFIPEHGYKMVKKHHEIYLSDFRKVSSDKLRTILRQPVAKN